MLAEMLRASEAIIAKQIKATVATRLAEGMAYATSNGGKRIRAQLIITTALMLARSPSPAISKNAVRVAAAYECLHAYSLVHDDLPAMDDAATRRGQPACHIAFDEATAVLVGDALQCLAFEILADAATHAEAETRACLVADLARAAGVAGMAGGQMLDMLAETAGGDKPFGELETRQMQAMKTGALIGAAVVAGGRVAGADTATLTRLATLGAEVGAAFQIADDVLDVAGDAGRAGKPTQQDSNKATLVRHLGLDGARAEAGRLAQSAQSQVATLAKNEWADYLVALIGYVAVREA